MVTFIPNLRESGLPAADVRQAYVDTPAFIYSDWLEKSGGIDGKIGTPTKSGITIGIVGAGAAGSCAAFELQKCGYDVTLYDAPSDHEGGRLYSSHFREGNSTTADIAELGAMRFPPTEEVLFYYLNAFGIQTDATFPDPGKSPTWLSFQGNGQIWDNVNVPPKGFGTVRNGFVALNTDGIKNANGITVFQSPAWFNQQLKLSPTNGTSLNSVTSQWQQYLNEFENDSFYTGLTKIFGPQAKWAVPGGTKWTEEDFTKFGAIGIGSGGFGPLYTIGFLYIYRLLTNALESDQAFVPSGISRVCEELISRFQSKGGTFIPNTRVRNLANVAFGPGPTLTFEDGSTKSFDGVIIAISTRAMEMGMNLTQFLPGSEPTSGNNAFVVTPEVGESINRIHEISSTKLFLRTKKFWEQKNSDGTFKYPRNLLSDTKLPQLYTLNYDLSTDPNSSGVVLVTYTWEDDATKTQALSPMERLTLLKEQIKTMTADSPFPDFADQLVPFTGTTEADYELNMRSIDWQSEKDYYGAFTLAQAGQDHYIDTMFRDFGRVTTQSFVNPVFIAGDCSSWAGGWSEGAFHTGLNAAAGIVGTFGTLAEPSNPITKVALKRYNYYPG